MTQIVIATRDGILTTPGTGEKFRLVKGRTLADARHPGVTAYPDNFMPVEIELGVDDLDAEVSRETSPANEPDEDLTTELVELRETAEAYQVQLSAIAEALAARGLLPDDEALKVHGWLVAAVTAALDAPGRFVAAVEPEDVPPPRKVARPARTATRSDGAQ